MPPLGSASTANDDLDHDGACLLAGAGLDALPALAGALAGLPADRAGLRLYGLPALRPLLDPTGPVGALAAGRLGRNTRPVRALLFDKSAATNWSLGWHQDRTIVVQSRHDVAGFGPWTRKRGLIHVAPPFGLLAGMVTLRLHLDPVGPDNAPLLIAPGSHRLGIVPVDHVSDAVRQCGVRACLADAGDVWMYSTPILHASHAARHPTRRRVLQVDYAPFDLPGNLRWSGI